MFVRSIEKAETSNRNNRVRELLSFAVFSVLALTLFAGKAHAQIIGDLDANIPFQFHVGNKEFPAGNYRIRMVDDDNLGVMQITSIDSTAYFMVPISIYLYGSRKTPRFDISPAVWRYLTPEWSQFGRPGPGLCSPA